MLRVNKETVVYSDDNLDVYHFDNGSSVLLVLFNEFGFSSKTESWGGEAARKAGFSYLGFVSRFPNWFPRSSMEKFRERLGGLLQRYAQVVTYGHSQGGYAAIKYSALLGAKTILSFCPQYSIAPGDMKGRDQRFSRFFPGAAEHKAIESRDVQRDARVFVFFDPGFPIDKENVRHIQTVIPYLTRIHVFGTGHNTIRPFAGSATLHDLVNAALLGNSRELYGISRRVKRRWPGRRAYLAREILSRRQQLALYLIEGNLDQINDELAPYICQELMHQGRYDFLAKHYAIFARCAVAPAPAMLKAALLANDQLGDLAQLERAAGFIESALLPVGDASVFRNRLECAKPFKLAVAEGWHGEESWGFWGGAIRSRLFLDLTSLPPSVGSVTLPVSVFLPQRQALRIRLTHRWGEEESALAGGKLVLRREMGPVVVDFLVDRLYSPRQVGANSDSRLLGVKLAKPGDWVLGH